MEHRGFRKARCQPFNRIGTEFSIFLFSKSRKVKRTAHATLPSFLIFGCALPRCAIVVELVSATAYVYQTWNSFFFDPRPKAEPYFAILLESLTLENSGRVKLHHQNRINKKTPPFNFISYFFTQNSGSKFLCIQSHVAFRNRNPDSVGTKL